MYPAITGYAYGYSGYYSNDNITCRKTKVCPHAVERYFENKVPCWKGEAKFKFNGENGGRYVNRNGNEIPIPYHEGEPISGAQVRRCLLGEHPDSTSGIGYATFSSDAFSIG